MFIYVFLKQNSNYVFLYYKKLFIIKKNYLLLIYLLFYYYLLLIIIFFPLLLLLFLGKAGDFYQPNPHTARKADFSKPACCV